MWKSLLQVKDQYTNTTQGNAGVSRYWKFCSNWFQSGYCIKFYNLRFSAALWIFKQLPRKLSIFFSINSYISQETLNKINTVVQLVCRRPNIKIQKWGFLKILIFMKWIRFNLLQKNYLKFKTFSKGFYI